MGKFGSLIDIDRKLLFSRTARRVSFFAQRRDFQHGASLFKEPLIKKPSTKTSSRWIKKWERAEGRKGLRQQSGG
jgi:CxxC motif-containing protein (DUF1111 family)